MFLIYSRKVSEIKNILTLSSLLTYLDPKLDIILATDESDYCRGAMFPHKYDNSSKSLYPMCHNHYYQQKGTITKWKRKC